MRKNLVMILWIAAVVFALGLPFSFALVPEWPWLSFLIALLLVGDLVWLGYINKQALRSRTAAYGLNSAVTIVLVICIVGVVNFLASRYPGKLDLTKNKIHTLSDQTKKVVKGLQKPVKAVLFSKVAQREQDRPLLENLRGLNPGKFSIEYVDPDKEPARAKEVGIKKYGTLQLIVGTRDTKVEDVTEEKITNAIIKLSKDRAPTLCAITGHGEKNFNSMDADGYDSAKKALAAQAYEVKDVQLLQETKIPDSCDAIAIMGPTKAFFPPEIKAIRDYLDNGGRGVIAVDLNIKGVEYSPEILQVLADWHVKADSALIVDPFSRMLGVDAAVPILATFSKDNPITKDFQGNCLFPLTRPLEAIPQAPAGMNVQWLAQTTPKSWAETDFKQLASGKVQMDPGKDKAGPLTVAYAVEGKQKDSKAPRNTRLVAFGTSAFATNQYARFAGNTDFFMNAMSWVMEDESLISIRSHEEERGRVELTEKAGNAIGLLTIVIIPLLIAIGGIVIWVYRRKL